VKKNPPANPQKKFIRVLLDGKILGRNLQQQKVPSHTQKHTSTGRLEEHRTHKMLNRKGHREWGPVTWRKTKSALAECEGPLDLKSGGQLGDQSPQRLRRRKGGTGEVSR